MALSVCPSAVVAAPLQVVWDILTEPATYGEWADARVESVTPPGRITPGQIIRFAAPALGRNWGVRFTVGTVDLERHSIELRVDLPLGMRLDEHLACAAIDQRTCRVQYG